MFDSHKIDAYFNGEKDLRPATETMLTRRAKIMRWIKLALPSLAALLIGLLIVLPGLQTDDDRFELEFETTLASIAVTNAVNADADQMKKSSPAQFSWIWDIYAQDKNIIPSSLSQMKDMAFESPSDALSHFKELLSEKGSESIKTLIK